ncbi:MAG: hypothetical protein LBP73_00950 [Clostridiales Family XIII bacterium]|jgi:hypothetical protein|nr:hypothetical protein [Clostridiales Family XIII bacterium]
MDVDGLFALLEIESPEEFCFFEYYAELVESETDIPFEALRALFSAVDQRVLAELTEGYFEETLSGVPDDQTEFYTLLDSIGRNMTHLARRAENRGLDVFTEEFLRFRRWYTTDRAVRCENRDSRAQSETSVCEALTLSRLERLGEPDYFFDFGDCMEYPLTASVHLLDELADGGGTYFDENGDDARADEDEDGMYMLPDDYRRDGDVYL